MIGRVLIANRGEIAVRVQRACADMGIASVAVHSTADTGATHVVLADRSVCIGPPATRDSYLNMDAIIAAALATKADAIHPGYGFLSENAVFAEKVEQAGLIFIGPRPEHIRMMGDKIAARRAAGDLGLPLVPGSADAVSEPDQAVRLAHDIGYPVIVKAAAGGGGRGMKVARTEAELPEAFSLARAEAQAAFGDNAVYIEKFLDRPRHVEVQILGDGLGNVVHLGERDCSLQRRHQKLVEEAGSPALDAAARKRIGELSAKAMAKIGYRGAGTLEFLYQDGIFAFIEMNTRLQVEHPVTEMISGIDLVQQQIHVANGQKLGFSQRQVGFAGHAIECRINAEDPETFMPSPGMVTGFSLPGGPGIRIDSALRQGSRVPPFYDSLLAKLIACAPTREQAIARMRRALDEFDVQGVKTTLPLHRRILRHPAFLSGDYTVHSLERTILPDVQAAA